MWNRLASLHQVESPASRFIAYNELFSINLQDGESLTSLISRVETATQNLKQLRPSMYTLANLDDELSSMALIRALPFEAYGNFRSSLLLMADVSYRTVKSAFLQEARNRQPRASELSMALQAAVRNVHQIPDMHAASAVSALLGHPLRWHLALGAPPPMPPGTWE